MISECYIVKVNGHKNTHKTHESAMVSRDRIAQAVDDGRSIQAELWRHTVFPWDELFYQGLLDPVTQALDPVHCWALPGKVIGFRQSIAALNYP